MATSGVPLWSTTAATNATADPAVNWAEGQSPSSVNDSARGMMASVAKWRDDLYGLTTAGTSTAFTVATNATYASATVMSGALFMILPHTTSGAAATLSVDGLTARALNIATGVAIPTGALVSGTPYFVKYVHASTEFIVIGAVGASLLSSLDIIGGTQLTSVAADDTLPIYDSSATANRRILVSDALKVVNSLTEDTSPDGSADYVLSYDNSATAAKKVLLNNLPKAVPVPGSYKSLSIKVASNTTVTVAADFVVTTDGTNFKTTAVSSTINLGTTGADALDTGTIAISSWYYIWVIARSDGTTKCVASLQATANATFLSSLAAIASGVYTYYARIGAVRTTAGSPTLFGTWQLGNRAQYILGLAQTTGGLQILASDGDGSMSTPTWVSKSVSSVVPSTAKSIIVILVSKTTGAMAAPNNSYGASTSSTNPPPLQVSASASGQGPGSIVGELLLESTNIYYAGSGTGNTLQCLGWTDNI